MYVAVSSKKGGKEEEDKQLLNMNMKFHLYWSLFFS
jgi:hypothetical protein